MKRPIPSCLSTLSVLATLAVALLLPAGRAGAQAVDPTLGLSRPSPGVSHTLDALRVADKPRVAVYDGGQIRAMSSQNAARVRDAVYGWEIFLLGLQVPFRTVDDRALEKGLPKEIDVLILPAGDALTGGQRKTVLRFVKRGGGLIANGEVGQFDGRGRAVNDPFFMELFGAEFVRRVPEQPYGLLHTIDAATPLGYGVPPGFRLNVAAQRPLSAARPMTAVPLGRMFSYSGRDDARLDGLTLMLAHEVERGRAVWIRFGPQDVSRERSQQAAYQRMVVNALAYLGGARTVAVRPWPNAAKSALSVVALPTVGFDPVAFLGGYDDLLDLLGQYRVPTTFFLSSGEARAFPDLVRRMASSGEIAIAAESDDVLLGQPMDVQAGRMVAARNALSANGIRGVYPPGGFHDGNTLRAAVESGFSYVLLPGGESLSPAIARWWEDVDYRALQAAVEQVDLAFLRSNSRRRNREAAPKAPAPEPKPAIVLPLDAGMQGYLDRFDAVERAGGLYVLPFYPESYRAGAGRSLELRDVLTLASDHGTWTATLSDVVSWWSSLAAVSVDMVESDRDRITFDVTNNGRSGLDGVTLDLRLGDAGVDSIDGDGAAAELLRGPAGTYHLVISRLPVGTSRFTLNLR